LNIHETLFSNRLSLSTNSTWCPFQN
jgi:hypothetical protein